MKHNSNLLNERVVFGLFSLLFILSAAQVAAILDMNEYEIKSGAQVSSMSSSCLQVTHKANIDVLQFYDESELTPANQYWFRQYFSIKNICSYNVHIINPTGLNQNNALNPLPSLSYTKLQTHTNLTPQDVPLIGNNYETSVVFEAMVCSDCESGALAEHYSPLATGQSGQIHAYALAPGQTRLFEITDLVSMPDYPTAPMRITTDKIKYFPQSAVAGGVADREIKTHTFNTAAQNTHATDYVVSSHSAGFEPMILGGGANAGMQKGLALPSLSAVQATLKSLAQ